MDTSHTAHSVSYKQSEQKLIIKFPRKAIAQIAPPPVPASLTAILPRSYGFEAFEPPNPPLPLPMPEVAIPSADQKEAEYTFQLSDDADLFELNSEDLGQEFNAWLNTMPEPVLDPLYLVRFDARLCRHITFCDVSRKELVRKYIMHLAHDVTTAEYQTIRSASEKLPENQIRERAGSYLLACVIQGCSYQETQLSVQELKVKMVLHHLLDHQKDSEWYQSIVKRIKENFEEALEALKEASK